MKNQMLLLDDIDGLGKKGEIVTVKPGFARNFLLPQKKAVIAEKHLVKLQDRLRKERAKKSAEDQQVAIHLSKQLEGKSIKTKVKVDVSGHMYGSVSSTEVAQLCNDQLGTSFDRKNIGITRPIKKLGTYEIDLKFDEGVTGKIFLQIESELAAAPAAE